MKSSRFNLIVKKQDGIFLYNTFSEGIIKLDAKYAEQYLKFSEGSDEVMDEDLKNNLIAGKMIVENGVNEIQILKAQNNILRFSDQSFGLTLTPTMKCNFVCPYCYEKGHKLHTMSQETIDEVKQYLEKIKEKSNNLSIAWYGGEPLLAFDIIREITQEAVKLFGENYQADMVTNGYLLTRTIAEQLKQMKINRVQITIDGPPDIHNKMRKLPTGEDTFFVILKNIKEALEIFPELSINIRVNVDKTNIVRVDEILQYLDDYDLKGKVGLYLAPIDNINNTCNASQCFNCNEFAKEQLAFAQRHYKSGYNFSNIPHANLYMCGAVASNSLVIDAEGDMYKCWDDVGHKGQKVGSLKDGIKIDSQYANWIAYDIFNDTECTECKFLPTCMGGCPNYRIKKEKKCGAIKENAIEMVNLMYDIKQLEKRR